MRELLAVCLLAAVGSTTSLAPAQSHPVFETPPATLALPSHWSAATLAEQKGNLARWRDAERTRVGPYVAHQETIAQTQSEEAARQSALEGQRACLALPPARRGPCLAQVQLTPGVAPSRGVIAAIGGYFMATGNAAPFRPGAILQGSWSDESSERGARSLAQLTLVDGAGYCGVDGASVSIGELTYLGPRYDRHWPALAAQVAGAAPSQPDREIPYADLRAHADGAPLDRMLPMNAFASGRSGSARLHCAIGGEGALTCLLVSEDPAGAGFGDSARTMLAHFSVAARDGSPVEGACTDVEMTFNAAASSAALRAPGAAAH